MHLVAAQLGLAAACRELRRRRLAARIGQAEIAAALGVDLATISNWENCHRPPLALNLFAWASYLEARIEVLDEEE